MQATPTAVRVGAELRALLLKIELPPPSNLGQKKKRKWFTNMVDELCDIPGFFQNILLRYFLQRGGNRGRFSEMGAVVADSDGTTVLELGPLAYTKMIHCFERRGKDDYRFSTDSTAGTMPRDLDLQAMRAGFSEPLLEAEDAVRAGLLFLLLTLTSYAAFANGTHPKQATVATTRLKSLYKLQGHLHRDLLVFESFVDRQRASLKPGSNLHAYGVQVVTKLQCKAGQLEAPVGQLIVEWVNEAREKKLPYKESTGFCPVWYADVVTNGWKSLSRIALACPEGGLRHEPHSASCAYECAYCVDTKATGSLRHHVRVHQTPLVIRGLSAQTPRAEVMKLLADKQIKPCGAITSRVARDGTGAWRVVAGNPKKANAAITALNGMVVHGRRLSAQLAP